jgi:hypothetical protein
MSCQAALQKIEQAGAEQWEELDLSGKDNQLWKQVPLNPEASCTELGWCIHLE